MTHHPEETVRLYGKLVATRPGFDVKGKKSRYTSLNGHMFSFITKEAGVALRLSADERKAFVEKYDSDPVVEYNTVMKEYVLVSAALLERTAEMAEYFSASVDYVSSLKPKPTTRRKKKATKKPAAKP